MIHTEIKAILPKILFAAVFGAVMAGCSNELQVMAPYKDIPVVYCVLNPNEGMQYLRLEKSFLGPASAYDMARVPDSIYYRDGIVNLERWADGELKESFPMTGIEAAPRDTGIFAWDPNYLYKVETPLKGNAEYRLNIRIPSTGATISATTHVVSEFRVIKPESFRKTLPFSSYDNYLTVEWVTAPYTRIYQLQIRFHYLEVTGEDTVKKIADWNIAHYVSEHGAGGEKLSADILQRNFYKWLGNQLDKPSKQMIRLAEKEAIDIIFTVGGEELYLYMEIYKPDSGVPKEKPVFTNIVGGIGLFSSRFRQTLAGKGLSEHSIDSLAYGMYTSELGFGDSQNDYYSGGR